MTGIVGFVGGGVLIDGIVGWVAGERRVAVRLNARWTSEICFEYGL
jgi:hypothetical protein